jgi:hypothetical protein
VPGAGPTGPALVGRAHPGLDLGAFGDADFRLWLSLAVPGSHLEWLRRSPAAERSGVVVEVDGSLATIDLSDHVVSGAADVYRQVEAAWLAFRAHGSPPRWRLGLSAQLSGAQYTWLDDPDGPVRWPVPG